MDFGGIAPASEAVSIADLNVRLATSRPDGIMPAMGVGADRSFVAHSCAQLNRDSYKQGYSRHYGDEPERNLRHRPRFMSSPVVSIVKYGTPVPIVFPPEKVVRMFGVDMMDDQTSVSKSKGPYGVACLKVKRGVVEKPKSTSPREAQRPENERGYAQK